MRNLRMALLTTAAVCTILGSAFTLALLRPSTAAPAPTMFSYDANWVCNNPGAPHFDPTQAENVLGLVPGEYETYINVHNPSNATTQLTIHEKVVESLFKVHNKAGATAILAPDDAFSIRCLDIFLALTGTGSGISGFCQDGSTSSPICAAEGFVVFTTTTPNLNVVVEHSSESYNATEISSGNLVFHSSGIIGVPTGISLDIQTIQAQPFTP